jgi:nucleotide-binding universal stress UspA family protein
MRVLVATDLSFGAGTAMRWVATHLSDADISVVHCRTEADGTDPNVSVRESRDGFLRTQADEWLLEWAPNLYHRGGVVEIVHSGELDALHRLTRMRSVDLLVVGQQGAQTGTPRRLGRTADRLAREANVSVLVVPASPHPAPEAIVVALDGGELEPVVLSWTRRLARRVGGRVVGVHVVPSSVPAHLLASVASADARDAHAATHPRADEEPLLRTLLDAGLPPSLAETEVAFGEVAHELLGAAERHRAGIIVLGRRSRGGVRRALLGSVVREVLHRASCPVLVVTPPEDEIE